MTAQVALIDRVFPVEILLAVFKLVDEKDRCRLCITSRRWQYILYNAPELWKRLDLSNRYTLGGDKFIELEEFQKNTSRLLRLLFSSSRNESNKSSNATTLSLTPSFFRFTSITRLDLSCTGIDIEFFSNNYLSHHLAHSLTHLIISGCPLVNSGSLYHLKNLKSLVYLDISHCDNMDDCGMDVLVFFVPWIKELNLAYNYKLTERGVKKLFRLSELRSLNLMGCCRVKSYPWAVTDANPNTTLMLKELMIGEDSRIQTRGFWLLWCTWQRWDMKKLSTVCPFLETIRLNMVLFDIPNDGLRILLEECKNLKILSLVIERNTIESLCTVSEKLRQLKQLDLTIHIGIQGEQIDALVAANALPRLKALKFHSKHTSVFNDASLSNLVSSASTIEYLELNGDDLTSSALINVVDKVLTLQSLLLHHVKLSNNAMRSIAKKCKNLRDLTITDLQVDTHGIPAVRPAASRDTRIVRTSEREMAMNGLGAANKLKWIVSDPSLCMKLKKIELASYDGFSDRDLAEIPKACKHLQYVISVVVFPFANQQFSRWVDFHFSFTFPKTLIALGKHCPGLLYLRLFHCNPPITFQAGRFTPVIPNRALTTTTSPPSAIQQSPTRTSFIVPATSPSGSRLNIAPSFETSKRRPTNTSTPFMASLYGHKGQSGRDRKKGKGKDQAIQSLKQQEMAAIPTKPSKPGSMTIVCKIMDNATTTNDQQEVKRTKEQKSKAVYPCSSAECQALINFALPTKLKKVATSTEPKKYSTKLRVLDLSGNHGISDHILSTAFGEGLTSLHTLFLEGCDESLTEAGVVKFAEARYRSLKRLHIRNCRGVNLNVTQENFLSRGLEIDLLVDGGRFRPVD
ncbi:UNVERIFIED_CONTAM: hypothetical protein HDU68_000722 [Siphonaria sp. JEL0065]|nr:hypothetical protein HDU68_000722 [Siphonaria sp. JEL0065]